MSNGDFPDPGSPFGGQPTPGGGISIGELINWIVGLLAAIWAALVAAIQFVWNTLVAFIKAVVDVFKKIGKIFKPVFDFIVRKALIPLIHLYQRLHAWLVKVLGPVIKILRRIRQLYDQFFLRYIKPVLTIINHLRQVLAIFKVFHIKWAQKLDQDLAKIESTIIKDFEKLRQEMNQMISWIQLIEDPAGLLLRGPLAASIKRALDDILKATTGHDLNYYSVSHASGPSGVTPGPSIADVKQEMAEAVAGASNVWSGYATQATDLADELNQAVAV